MPPAALRQSVRPACLTVAAADLQAGLPSMLVWVLAANPARSFYERLGGKRVRGSRIEIGGELLDEVGYGWADTRALAAM